MKKIKFLFALLLMVFVSNYVCAQDEDAEYLTTFKGVWDLTKVDIDKTNTASATKTAEVKNELIARYKGGSLALRMPAQTFSFMRAGKEIFGKMALEGENLVLTAKDGSIFLNGKLYEFNETKNMGISFVEKGVAVNLIFEK